MIAWIWQKRASKSVVSSYTSFNQEILASSFLIKPKSSSFPKLAATFLLVSEAWAAKISPLGTVMVLVWDLSFRPKACCSISITKSYPSKLRPSLFTPLAISNSDRCLCLGMRWLGAYERYTALSACSNDIKHQVRYHCFFWSKVTEQFLRQPQRYVGHHPSPRYPPKSILT